MSNNSKFVQLEREFGTIPSSRFLLRLKVCKLQLLRNIFGISPVRLFLLRFRTSRVSLIAMKQWGIVPLKELLDRSRISIDEVLHIASRIYPLSLLLERDKNLV